MSIVLRNRSRARVEAVLAVDGLDVLDGEAASFGKRGFIVPPRSVVRVNGFRQGTESFAPFRFHSVQESTARLKRGETKEVGVIGVAFFNEKGNDPLRKKKRRR